MDADIQERRAIEYALCIEALRNDRVPPGAEGVFDQALNNGLAAIVAFAWPGHEFEPGKTKVRSATALLNVINRRGEPQNDGTIRVMHDPSGPEYELPSPAFPDDPWPNFTTVDELALRKALDVTHAVRHGRAAGDDRSASALKDAHLDALAALSAHPALGPTAEQIAEEHSDGARAATRARDVAERQRANAFYQQLDPDERSRREAANYRERHEGETKHGDRCVVERCRGVRQPGARRTPVRRLHRGGRDRRMSDLQLPTHAGSCERVGLRARS